MQGQKMNNKKSKIIIGIIIGILVLAGGGIGIYFVTTNKDTPESTTETLAENNATELDSEEKTTTENNNEKKTTEEITTEENVTETTTETITERENTTEATTERETTTETTTEHTHSYKVVNSKEATCTENGYVEYKCSCGDSYKETVNAHGHKWSTKTTTETIYHEEEGHEELWVHFNDGYEIPYDDAMISRIIMEHGGSYCEIVKWIVDKPAWTETITHETTTCDHCGATK